MPDSSSITLDSVRVLFEKGTYFGNDSIFALPGKAALGEEGLLTPYTPQQEIAVVVALVLVFLLFCFTMNRGRVYFRYQLKMFFQERARNNMFTETGIEFHNQSITVLCTSITAGVLLFDQAFYPVFPPYLIARWQVLLCCIIACLLYYTLKVSLYRWVNWVFFDEAKYDRWNDILTLVISLQGCLFFPVVCLSVYSQLGTNSVFLATLFIILLSKFLLFYKARSIFFEDLRGLFYNILYLCTLEMTPLVILWKIIRDISGIS